MPAFEAGAALPVAVDTASGKRQAGAAVPVYVASGGPQIAGPARRVVIVTDGPVAAGAAVPVYEAAAGAVLLDGPAVPVFVVQGSLGAVQTYSQKVAALGPLAYWPLAEASGTTINDESGNGRNGVYSAAGITLGQAGIGDGRTAASFNGSTGTGNIHSASFAGAFNGQEGTAALWFKVAAGVWTDGAIRKCLHLFADANNRVLMQKTGTNNQLSISYIAGATNETISFVTAGPTTWQHFAVTWSKAADQVKLYVNGAQQGATATSLGTFAGALTAANQRISGTNATPTEPWSGQIAHVAVWNTPLSAVQIASLATP